MSKHLLAYIAAHFVGSSTYLDESEHQQEISAYTRVDARIGYRLGVSAHPWTISIAATNLFDNKHFDLPSVESEVPGTAQRRTL